VIEQDIKSIAILNKKKENAMIPKILFSRKIILVFCCVILMMSLLGVEAQAGRLSMPSGENLAAPDDVITHTTFTDFDQTCAVKTNAHISDNLGGSVELAGALSDNFDGTTLDSTRWISGTWSSPNVFTPVVSGGKLTIPAGWYVRSDTAVFTRGVMSGKIEFTQGDWQQVGFGATDLLNDLRYLFFSTLNTALTTPTLYARVGLPTGHHDEPVRTLPTGMHRYGIQWLASNTVNDQANYLYDGDSIYSSLPFSNTLLSNMNLWMTNNGTLNLSVDEIQVAPPYVASGSYVSCPLDAGAGLLWQTVSWVTDSPANTSLTVQTHTSPDGLNWTTWATVPTSGGYIASPDRYVEYQILLETTNVSSTAALDSITLTSGAPSADLNLTKTVSKSNPEVGQTVDFTVTVNNAGPSAATNVEVKDLLQNGYTFFSANATLGTYDNVSGLWTVGAIPAAGNVELTLRAVVNATGIYSNDAEVWKSDIPDIDSTPGNGAIGEDDYGTITLSPVPVADLSILKTLTTTKLEAGKQVVFQIRVTNSGPSSAEGVSISDVIPANHVFVSSDHTAVNNSGILTWNLGTIPASQDVVIQLTLQANVPGSYSNQVQVMTSNIFDPDSLPGNGILGEDDLSSVQYSVKSYIYLPLVIKNP
jgi:uncharacterized repeat protein (TIGR01451 family)